MISEKELQEIDSRELLFGYQIPALKEKDTQGVVQIGEEMERRLHNRGLIRTRLGWFSPEKVERGEDAGVVSSAWKDGWKNKQWGKYLHPVITVQKSFDKDGRLKGSVTNSRDFVKWLESDDEGKVSGKETKLDEKEHESLGELIDFTAIR